MEFADVVRTRRMVRGFLDTPVAAEVVDRLVETIRHAPSAGFAQGVAVVVVTDAGRRRAVARVAGEERYTSAGHRPWISEAPVQIVLCTSEEVYHRRYREPDKLRPDGTETEWPIPYWHTDAGAALMLLLLAAVDAGLSAAFVGVYRWRELQALLGIPAEFVPIGVVLVGHSAPARRSRSLARGRRPLGEIVHRETW
ncbi:MAG: nitroreductase family protein [Chloroflexi bacterium]|nr:nitroreductase family protein [Chloroflexota bacterium]